MNKVIESLQDQTYKLQRQVYKEICDFTKSLPNGKDINEESRQYFLSVVMGTIGDTLALQENYWYNCKCGYNKIFFYASFCGGCGKQIEW